MTAACLGSCGSRHQRSMPSRRPTSAAHLRRTPSASELRLPDVLMQERRKHPCGNMSRPMSAGNGQICPRRKLRTSEELMVVVGYNLSFDRELLCNAVDTSFALLRAAKERLNIPNEKFAELEAEVLSGECVLHPNEKYLVERVVNVEVVNVLRQDGRVLVRIGSWNWKQGYKARCELPGGKRGGRENPRAALTRVLAREFGPFAECIELGAVTQDVVTTKSLSYGIPSTYLRTSHSAHLKQGFEHGHLDELWAAAEAEESTTRKRSRNRAAHEDFVERLGSKRASSKQSCAGELEVPERPSRCPTKETVSRERIMNEFCGDELPVSKPKTTHSIARGTFCFTMSSDPEFPHCVVYGITKDCMSLAFYSWLLPEEIKLATEDTMMAWLSSLQADISDQLDLLRAFSPSSVSGIPVSLQPNSRRSSAMGTSCGPTRSLLSIPAPRCVDPSFTTQPVSGKCAS